MNLFQRIVFYLLVVASVIVLMVVAHEWSSLTW
jgi:hypothetical protein